MAFWNAFRLYLIVVFTYTLSGTEAGQLCGACVNVIQPKDCSIVTTCGDHEQCVVEKYVTTGGRILFDLNCESNFRCAGLHGGRRSIWKKAISDVSMVEKLPRSEYNDGRKILCKQCCNDTKACNIKDGYCGSDTLDTYGALMCFSCDQMANPKDCDSIRLCSIDEQCYLGQTTNKLDGSVLWTSRCGANRTECDSINAISMLPIGKRQSGQFCQSCCNSDNFCNYECHANPIVHHPPTTHTAAVTTSSPKSVPQILNIVDGQEFRVRLGEDLQIPCVASGNPKPTIQFGILTPTPNAPANLEKSNDITLHIIKAEGVNFNQYRCVAINSMGNDTKLFMVVPAV